MVALLITEDIKVTAGTIWYSVGKHVGGFGEAEKGREERVVETVEYGGFPPCTAVGIGF